MNPPHLIDTHCHIDLFKDPAGIIAEVERQGIYTIAVTNAPFVYRHTAELVSGCRYVRAAAGLHPELVASHGNQLPMLQPLLKETRYVGEIGLDYSTLDLGVRQAQRQVFSKILEWCSEDHEKILTVHSRRAASDVISAVNDLRCKVILHWFSGSNKELDKALNTGVYFSVNPAMATSIKGSSLISRIPRDRILTESDGPFVKISGQVADPTAIGAVIHKLGDLWKISIMETRRQIYDNFRALLKSSQ